METGLMPQISIKKLERPVLIMIIAVFALFFINSYRAKLFQKNSVEYIRSELAECYNKPDNDPEQDRCLKELALVLSDSLPFKDIVESLDRLATKYSCHDVMHYVVNEEYRRGSDLSAIYEQCTGACFNACYHGGLEGYFEERNLRGAPIEKINEEILTLCNQVRRMHSQCYHGLGHALMLITEGDLIQSLKSCDLLGNYAELCYAGVFMENIPSTATQKDHPSKYIKADDPLYPCNILDDKYLESCYSFQMPYFYYLAGNNWKKAGEYCDLVPEEYYGLCFRRIGSSTITPDLDFNYPNSVCASLPAGLPEEYCIRGVMDSFVDRFTGNNEKLLKMIDFCPTVKPAYQKACFEQVGITLSQLGISPVIYRKACDEIADPVFRQSCSGTGP